MDIDYLKQYKDACALCDEIDKEIEQLHKNRNEVVSDCVTGSDSQYPYVTRKYTISGIPVKENESRMSRQEKALLSRKAAAEEVKENVEIMMKDFPLRIQRIVKYKFIEGLSWERVADKMGGRCTGESLRKELKRYLNN